MGEFNVTDYFGCDFPWTIMGSNDHRGLYHLSYFGYCGFDGRRQHCNGRSNCSASYYKWNQPIYRNNYGTDGWYGGRACNRAFAYATQNTGTTIGNFDDDCLVFNQFTYHE